MWEYLAKEKKAKVGGTLKLTDEIERQSKQRKLRRNSQDSRKTKWCSILESKEREKNKEGLSKI